jgi:hypothetical protein
MISWFPNQKMFSKRPGKRRKMPQFAARNLRHLRRRNPRAGFHIGIILRKPTASVSFVGTLNLKAGLSCRNSTSEGGNIEHAKHCARKTGYIGYIFDNQQFNRLQNQLHTGYTSYIVDFQQLPHT